MERERLARVFEKGIETPVGTVLPVAREANGRGRWRSGPWFLRTEKCYLIPGTRRSAIACRSIRCRGPHRRTWTRSPSPIQ